MPDVFISYSRKDKVFVQKLHDALAVNSRDVWIDWEDIPLSADWWAEIRAGIESADTFIFVISPDSVVSEVCYKEISCAVELNKRIIPILYREVDAKTVPQEVASLNWIFFRETDDFDSALKNLINTMDTDLEWLKAHTRLTVRAIEWDRKGRNDSFLLRGDDLNEAEQLLIQMDKEPPLTDLQGWYIMTSRQNAAKRQRIIIGAITFGLIVAVILGLVAFMNFLRADREFRRANLAEQTAVAGAATAWAAADIAQVERGNARQAQKTAEAGEQIAWHAVATAEQAQATAEANSIRAVTAEALAYLLRDQAEMERALVTSRKLATDALLNLETDPELSALLAQHGLEVAYTEEAEQALRRALDGLNLENVASVYSLDIEALQSLAQTRVTRQFTLAECQKYLHQDSCS